MIDLHTHTFLSDGVLGPAEHIRCAEVKGYRILGISDHADFATMPQIVPAVIEAARRENELRRMTVLAGIELTHVRPEHFEECVKAARKLGAQYVIGHGQSIVEPVAEGTNRAAIEAGVDILAHPGLISESDAALAARRGVRLEVSAKSGHSLGNGHVVAMARKVGAQLIFGTDSHGPDQFATQDFARRVCLGAGLSDAEIDQMFDAARQFAQSLPKL